MKDQKELCDQFNSHLYYHSSVSLHRQFGCHSLYKLAVKPFDYYLKYCFQGDLSKLHFYQDLSSLSNLIIPPSHISVEQIEQSYFDKWFSPSEKKQSCITFYSKYSNYTLKDWIINQRQCNSIIQEQAILTIWKQLLTFDKVYYQSYGSSSGIFKSQSIYITPGKLLKIYPQIIKLTGRISNRGHPQPCNSKGKLNKLVSVQTSLSTSRVQEVSHNPEDFNLQLMEDLRDIFIMVFQLIFFKNYDHFYSKKHSRIIWDSLYSLLNSSIAFHLSKQFLGLLKQCTQNQFFETEVLLRRINKIIESKDKMGMTIRIHQNQELAQLRQNKIDQEKAKRLLKLNCLHFKTLSRIQTSKCNAI